MRPSIGCALRDLGNDTEKLAPAAAAGQTKDMTTMTMAQKSKDLFDDIRDSFTTGNVISDPLGETLNKFPVDDSIRGNSRLFAGEGARATLIQSFLR